MGNFSYYNYYNSVLHGTAENYIREKNDHWTYKPYALAIAKNKPIGVAGIRYYEASEFGFYDKPFFVFSGMTEIGGYPEPEKDYLMCDFTYTDGGNGIDLEGTASYWNRWTHFGGITSSWDGGSLYGWMNNKVYKFADDFKSYDTFKTYGNLGSIKQLKVQYNAGGVEEFFLLADKEKGMALNSMFGDVNLPNTSLIGFDFK